MRLIGCYIENYGKLSEYSLRFNEGITVINEENGFGKTTLASFITAMFYGLPQTTKRSLKENERKLRTPWQKGSFGGTLDFELKGKIYRIERFFGSKANDDTFRLFDLSIGKECADYSENIGVELFGIDLEGFKRSVFLPQLDVATESNVSIMTKLTDLVENSDDINNYDKAVEQLEKRRSELIKLNGKKGTIAELKNKILVTETELNDGRVAYDNVKALTSRIKELEARQKVLVNEREQVRKQLSAASDAAAVRANKNRRDELLKEINDISVEIEAINKKYPKGLPQESELQSANETALELKSLSEEYRLLRCDGEEEAKQLEALAERFSTPITDEQLDTIRADVLKLDSLKVVAQTKKEFLARSDTESIKPSKSNSFVPLIIASVVVAVFGVAMLLFNQIAGVAALFVALVLGGIAAFFNLKGMITGTPAVGDTGEIKAQYSELLNQIEVLEKDLSENFSRYGLSGDFSASVYELVSLKKDYEHLSESMNSRNEKIEICAKKGRLAKETLSEFLQRFSVDSEKYSEELLKMRDASRQLAELTERYERLRERLKEIPEVREITPISEEEYQSLKQKEQEINPLADAVGKEIGDLKSRLAGLIPLADSVSELENEIESLKLQLQEQEQQLFVLEKTLELLEKARDRLTGRYRDPLAQGFKKYSEMILGEDIGEFVLDNELTVHLNRYGKSMDKGFFSEGYRNLIDIATRFALIDALYTDEKPAVILDDPFVNLDESKLDNALELLQKMAKDRQIVYLTCHKSRVPR